MPKETLPPSLDVNEILSREFEYAAQTAFQANEDRVRIFNYYIATAGTLVAALAVADFSQMTHVVVLAIVFTVLSIWGMLSFLELLKLRLAWRDSVRAMCQIKEYYLSVSEDDLARAFRWRMTTIPPADKKWSIAFLKGLTLVLLDAIAFGSAMFFWGWALAGVLMFVPAIVGAVVFFALHLALWKRILRPRSSQDGD